MTNDEFRDLDQLKAEIAGRLRNACAHFSESDFEELVDRIARVELKYSRRSPTISPLPEP